MKSIISSVKGTRDFYPQDMAFRTWLFEQIRTVAESFGYQEWDGPFLERIELYAAKSGEELVREQAFVFNDRGGDAITLRPELTPSLARMVAQKQGELILPLRWWSFGPFWRYERPQKGRSREFFQWNIDIIGPNCPEADAELLAVAATFLKKVGLGPDMVQLQVNSRKLMNEEMEARGINDVKRRLALQLIDRRDKMSPQAWEDYSREQGMDAASLSALNQLMEDNNLWRGSEDLRRAFDLLETMGLKEYITYSPQVIRGLDYYTGIVFEAKDVQGGRAILGGGRYENLVSAVGGDPLPASGFAMGDVMIEVTLEKYGKLPVLAVNPAQVLVTIFDEESITDSVKLANELRINGLKTIMYPEAVKLQKQLKFADRCGVRFVLIAGPDENSAGCVTVKDLLSRTQETVPIGDLVMRLRNQLAEAGGM
jgi:histidyl-tRNA synthetase